MNNESNVDFLRLLGIQHTFFSKFSIETSFFWYSENLCRRISITFSSSDITIELNIQFS